MPNLQGRGCEGYEPQTCHHNMETLVLMLGGQERLRSRLGRERCNQHREVYKLRKWPFIPLHPPSTIKRSKAKRQPSFHTQVCRRYLLSSKCFIFFTTAFGAVSMANPIANAEAAALAIPDDLPEWESYSTSLEARNADPAGLEARQGGPIACIATV